MNQDKKREADRQRKAEWRERQKQIRDNTYVATPLEQAKSFLEAMEDPDVNAVFQDGELSQGIKQEDRKTLSNFVYNLKLRRRREDEEESKRSEQQRVISEKGQQFVDQKTQDFHQTLSMPMSDIDRRKLIKDTIDTNLYLFLEYMENYEAPWNDFLEIVLGLKGFIDQESFTELFVRVCIYQKIEDLKVTPGMVDDALTFLVDKKKDERAAYGLLRLIFINNISLNTFQKTALIRFQEDYEAAILKFFRTLSQVEHHVTDSLPGSIFCFTTPILQALRDQGRIFYTQIPYQFMPYVIQITCYSFTEDESSFYGFIEQFKKGMKDHFNHLILNGFKDLLQRLLDDTKRMVPKFFGNLNYSTTVLERCFLLLQQRQIKEFTPKIINDLIGGDREVLKQMQTRARIIPQNSQMKINSLLTEIKAANKSLNLVEYNLQNELEPSSKTFFASVGIDNPLPLQIICFNFCTSSNLNGRNMIQLDTGSGKTALCFTIGCFFASKGQKVLIINLSEELTFRDFKSAEKSCEIAKIQVNFLEKYESKHSIQNGITFLSYRTFSDLIKNLERETINEMVGIVDEFDSILFNGNESLQGASEQLPKLHKLIGFTGSELKEFHVKAAERAIGGTMVRMNILNIFKPPPICHGVDVYYKISDYRDVLVALCEQQIQKTPIVMIADDDKQYIAKKLQKALIHVEALWAKEFIESNASLTIFTRKQGERYPVFIINECQGRGLDFPSTTDIEENGGVYLIVGKLPSSFLQFKQFLGRTGRIGNKSQYSVLLHDPDAKNEEGSSYLDKMLETLTNKDLQRVTSWLNQSCLTNNTIINQDQEEEKSGCPNQEGCISEKESNEKQVDDMSENKMGETFEKIQGVDNDNQKEEAEILQNPEQANDINSLPHDLKNRKRESKADHKREINFKKLKNAAIRLNEQRDSAYFQGYGQNQIHEEMLQDKRRVEAYEVPLKNLCKDKVVADVGAGTGILSIIAAEGGAAKVYAIEYSEIYKRCKREVTKKGLQHAVKVMNCLAEEVPIDPSEVDIIVSEWMGYFLLFERMLPSVLSVRDKCLKPGGIIIPNRVRIFLAAAQLSQQQNRLIVQQVDEALTVEPDIFQVKIDEIISSCEEVLDLNLYEAPSDFDSFESEFKLEMKADSGLNSIVGWFDANMTEDTWFSTSPSEGDTHWHQTVFPVIGAPNLKIGDLISGKIRVRPIHDDHRGLHVTLNVAYGVDIEDCTLQYFIR